MRISISRLRRFLAIVDAGGLTAAARELGMTQPTLSSSLSRLEQELGVRLFERGAGGLTLTAAGRVVERTARRSVAAQHALEETALSLRDGREGRLTVGSVADDAFGAFAPVAAGAFVAEHPSVQLRMSLYRDHEALATAVRSGRADIGFSEVVPGLVGLVSVALPARPLVLVLPPSWPARTLEELALEPDPLPIVQGARQARVLEVLAALGIATRVVVADASPGYLPMLSMQGVGAVVLSEPVGGAQRTFGSTVLPLPGLFLSSVLLHRAGDSSPQVRRFVRLTEAFMPDRSPWLPPVLRSLEGHAGRLDPESVPLVVATGPEQQRIG